MKQIYLSFIFLHINFTELFSQSTPLSEQMAATAMHLSKDSLVVGSSKDGKARWVYQESVYLRRLEEISYYHYHILTQARQIQLAFYCCVLFFVEAYYFVPISAAGTIYKL